MKVTTVLCVLALIAALSLGLFWWFGMSGEVSSVGTDSRDVPVGLPSITLAAQRVAFADGTSATLRVAEPFEITVAAEGLGKARFMTRSPDGRLFVPDMVDYELSHEGSVYILDDFNEETGRFESRTTYLSNLRGPNNIAFYTDEEGNDWLYLTLTEHLVRYPYEAGDTEPSGDPEVVLEFPNVQSEGAEGVVWHITRTVLFHDDTMYVAVGSGCNACEEAEGEIRAMIITADPDGSNMRVYAEGIKNAVGLAWVDGTLYATENGTDHLGNDAPDDVLFAVEKGAHYGWPYCYEVDGVKHADTSREWQREPIDCTDVPMSFSAFDPHAAPLGVTYFENAHPLLENSFLVALQGSWQPEIGTGYQIVRVSREGEQEVFIDGFLAGDGERVGRPVHVLQRDQNSFFVTDDFNGRLYYVYAG